MEFRLVLLGLGNVDTFHTELDGKPFEGITVRFFDHKHDPVYCELIAFPIAKRFCAPPTA